jgi:hypothetical protein
MPGRSPEQAPDLRVPVEYIDEVRKEAKKIGVLLPEDDDDLIAYLEEEFNQ